MQRLQLGLYPCLFYYR